MTNFKKSSLHFWTKFDDFFHHFYGERMEIVLTITPLTPSSGMDFHSFHIFSNLMPSLTQEQHHQSVYLSPHHLVPGAYEVVNLVSKILAHL